MTSATQDTDPAFAAPLALAGMGSFFVGGREVVVTGQEVAEAAFTPARTIAYDPNGHFAVDHAYVQWFRPARQVAARPVLFVHGGGMTGTTWETTPDGRPGWVDLFLRAGTPVFVIDNVERGRAGWCVVPGVWEGEAIGRSAEWAWELFRFGRREDFAAGIAFPGQRFPVGAMAAFCKSFVPRWTSTGPAQVAALSAAIRQIGPVDLVAHSQGGDIALRAAAGNPDLVRSVVALEQSGFADLHPGRQRVLTVLGDYWDTAPDSTLREGQMREFAAAQARAGVESELWDMTARGRPGHSHMLMMDAGHDRLAAEVLGWLAAG